MYYTYVLKSQINGDIYVGSTEDLAIRFKCHNDGSVRSTQAYHPWKLLEHRMLATRSEAVREERFLKTGQ